jgi:hypothetical protein
MVKNTFLHILICMLDEIMEKMILILFSNTKTFLYPPPKKLKPRRKVIPLWGYFVNTMGGIFLVQAIRSVLFMPIINTQCNMCNTPIKVY